MIRSFALSCGAGLALMAALTSGADESFPVVHNEPITLRILFGKGGQPAAHAHLYLVGGYDQRDMAHRQWQQEVLTDSVGNARLPDKLANLPLLAVTVKKRHECQTRGTTALSVERIRRDGFSTANRCGTVTVVDAPGVLTVFVKGNVKAPKPVPPIAPCRKPRRVPASIAVPSPGLQPAASVR